MRVGQSRLAPDDLDAVAIQVALDDPALVLDDRQLTVHQEADGQVLPQGVVDAVEPALAQTREIQRRLAKGLGGEGAGVDAGAAQVRRSLDQGHPLAEVGGLGGALLPGRAGADHDEVVIVSRRHDPCLRVCPDVSTSQRGAAGFRRERRISPS